MNSPLQKLVPPLSAYEVVVSESQVAVPQWLEQEQ